MAQRILVTGASGFVGSYLVPALRARWSDSHILGLRGDKGPPAPASEPSETVDLIDADAMAGVVERFAPDLVIHLAAQASVARSQDAGAVTWRVNLVGSLSLALAVARHAPRATVLFASSSEVYGASFLASPVSETSAIQPLNAYAKSKAAAESMFAAVLPATARLIIARPFNHTGPGQVVDFVLPSFASQIARMESGVQSAQLAVGNLDVRRDFLDVRDVIDAYVALGAAAETLPPRFTVNIASGEARALRDLVAIMRSLSATKFEIVVDPARMRPADVPAAFASPDLIKAVTGWAPRRSIDATLRDLLDHARHALA